VRLVSEFFLLYPAAFVVFGLTIARDASRTYRFLTHPLLLLGGRVSYAAYLLQFPVWTYVDRMAYGTFKNRFPPCSRHDPEAAASWTDCFAKSGYQEWPDVMVVWNVFLLFAVAYVVNRYYETKMVAFLARKMLAPRKEEGKAEPTGPKRTGGGGAE
jgi:peptidoglycan/LPS O-acetylase OafA/YrhL